MFKGELFIKAREKTNQIGKEAALIAGFVVAVPTVLAASRVLYTEIKIDEGVEFDLEPAGENDGTRFDENRRMLIVPDGKRAKLVFNKVGDEEINKEVLVEDSDAEATIKVGEGVESVYKDGSPTGFRFRNLHNIFRVEGNRTKKGVRIVKGIALDVTHARHRK